VRYLWRQHLQISQDQETVMAKLAIPASQRPAVIELTKLKDADVKAIAAMMDEAPATLDGVAAVLGKYVEDSEAAAEAIVSLSLLLQSSPIGTQRLVQSLAESLGDEYGGTDISALFEAPRVVTIAKAVDLQASYDRLLTKLRVITDIRLVFPKELSDDEAADLSEITTAVVANVLHLTYYENGRSHDVSFAVKASQLNALRDQFDRAIKKNIQIRKFVENAGVSVFSAQSDDEE
jgi:hypothetical protein